MGWPGERVYREGKSGEPRPEPEEPPGCSGGAEEAESAKEMEKRWVSKSQRATRTMCVYESISKENFKEDEVSKVRCHQEVKSDRDWKNIHQIERPVGHCDLSLVVQ